MPDLLVNLLKLPQVDSLIDQHVAAGVNIRRPRPFEITQVRQFIEKNFSLAWADEISVGFANKPISIYVATRGRRVIGFAGYECTRKAFFGPAGSTGTITQLLNTTPGGVYTVTFWLANFEGTPNFFAVHWGDTFTNTLTNWPAFVYTNEFSFDVTATLSVTALQFEFRQDAAFWLLDDVSVVGVPDAGSTVSLLGSALLGLAVLRRKLSC